MRSHPTYVSFERRWQLPVYFQLRWKEIVGKLEDTLNTAPRISTGTPLHSAEVHSYPHVDIVLDVDAQQGSPQAQGVIEAVRTCWQEDVYLDELGHRFWRLTLQIIFRYKNWLDDALPQREAPPQVAAAIRDEKVSNQDLCMGQRSQYDLFQASLGTNRSGSAAPGLPEPAEVTTTSDEARLTQLVILFTDIRIAVSRVMGLWSSEIGVVLPELDERESLQG